MAQNNARRASGTILMGLGLIADPDRGRLLCLVRDTRRPGAREAAAEARPLRLSMRAVHPAARQLPRASATPAPATKATEPTQPTMAPSRDDRSGSADRHARRQPSRPPPARQPRRRHALRRACRPPPSRLPLRRLRRAPRLPPPTSIPAPAATVASNEPVRMTIPDLKIDAQVVPMGWEVIQTKNRPGVAVGDSQECGRAPHQQRGPRASRAIWSSRDTTTSSARCSSRSAWRGTTMRASRWMTSRTESDILHGPDNRVVRCGRQEAITYTDHRVSTG